MAKGVREGKPKLALVAVASVLIGIIIGFYASGMAEKKDDTKEKMREMFEREFTDLSEFDDWELGKLENSCLLNESKQKVPSLIFFRSILESKSSQIAVVLYIYCDNFRDLIEKQKCEIISQKLDDYSNINELTHKSYLEFLDGNFTNRQKLCDLADYIRKKDYEAIKKLRYELG